MRRKHPARKAPITPLSEDELAVPRKGIDRGVLVAKLKGLKHDVAPGLGCLRNEHLLALLLNPNCQLTPSAARAVDNLCDFANAVVQVRLPRWFYVGWVACRLVPANKVDPADLPPGTPADCRPVNIGGSLQRLVTRAYYDDGLQETYNSIIGPVQNGVGVKGGISITAYGVQAVLDAEPTFCVFQGDLKNGYNEIGREAILSAMREEEQLDDTLSYTHALLEPEAYVGMGNGTALVTAPFRVSEGVHQGAIESGWLFSLGCNKAFQALNRRLAPHGGGVMAIVDDNYAMGPPEAVFPAKDEFAVNIAKVGLELQNSKSQCYIRNEYRNGEWDELRGEVPNGVLKDSAGAAVTGDDGQPLHDITVCNVPVGSRKFVEGYLEQKKTKIVKGFDKAVSLLDPCRWPHPEIPTRQMIWVLLLVCFQNMGDYWLRHIRPDYTKQFAKGIDAGVRSLFQTCVGCDITRWSDFAKELIILGHC